MDVEKIISDIRESVDSVSDSLTNSVMEGKILGKYKDSDDKIGDILEDAGKVVTGWFDAIANLAEPTVKKTKAKIYESIQDEYRKAGSPYGDTHEGLLRWVDEHESNVREKVDDGLEKSRKAVVDTAQKTKNYIDEKLTEKQPPSESTVDGEEADSEKEE